MAAQAFYGIEALSFGDVGLEDFHEMLARTIMHSPKRWNLVKYVYRDIETFSDFDSEKRFVIVFNTIVSKDEVDEFIEPFKDFTMTSFGGIEL